MMRFANRTDAGRLLAQPLSSMELTAPVVLALPRGGVPVAFEIARTLGAPLDLVMVRKIGVPSQPELAAGAVVNGDDPQIVVNEDIAARAGLSGATITRMAVEQMVENKRRRRLYLQDRQQPSLTGKTAIVVDDGIATGATVRAALKSVRNRKPLRLVLAVPVAAADTIAGLSDLVDDMICLETPEPFEAVGAHYEDFGQVSDAQVVDLMEQARSFGARDNTPIPGA